MQAFLVNNETTTSLKDRILKAAEMIKKAIEKDQPILVRHHSDADGYCAGIALEISILELTKNKHKEYYHRYYSRKPMKTPYYDYIDAALDIDYAAEDMTRYGKKKPLFIILDNGGTKGDVFALKRIKIYDPDILVIDHHDPGDIKEGRSEACNYVDLHVNPHLTGHGSALCAGILAAEVANMLVNGNKQIALCAGIAGIGDKVDDNLVKAYLEIAQMDLETARKLEEVIDYEAYVLRPRDSPRIFKDLLGEDRKIQQKMIDSIYPEIIGKIELQRQAVKHYLKTEEHNGMKLLEIDLDVTQKGGFPNMGKSTGIAHGMAEGARITLGLGDAFYIFRADGTTFDVNKLLAEIIKEIPHACAEGGGHSFAGSIRCSPIAKKEVLDYSRRYIRRQKIQ